MMADVIRAYIADRPVPVSPSSRKAFTIEFVDAIQEYESDKADEIVARINYIVSLELPGQSGQKSRPEAYQFRYRIYFYHFLGGGVAGGLAPRGEAGEPELRLGLGLGLGLGPLRGDAGEALAAGGAGESVLRPKIALNDDVSDGLLSFSCCASDGGGLAAGGGACLASSRF